MKIIFKDGVSVHNHPDKEHQFTTQEELQHLLSQYDKWQYAYSAVIVDDKNNELMTLVLNTHGFFQIPYGQVFDLLFYKSLT